MTTKPLTTSEILIGVFILAGMLTAIVGAYLPPRTKKSLIISMIHLVLYIAIYILVFQVATIENFFFEVSPHRKKCLMEQVSRKNFGKKMPCGCCGKGTTGGIPPNYAQWLGPSDSDTPGWFRPDHVRVDSFSNGQECQALTQPVYIQHI